MEHSTLYMLTHLHYSGIPALILLALLLYASIEALTGRLDRSKKLLKYAAITAIVGWIVYTIPFVFRDYTLQPVYESTSLALPSWLLPAAAWSTSGGSLYLFTVIGAIAVYLVARSVKNHRVFLAAAPWLPALVLLSALFYGAFELNPHPEPTGMGLNPLLKSFWLYPHPVTTFSGYALLAVTGLALALGLRSRSITVLYEIGWALLTIGIMLGGYWSYETFGWGGYWAWDPVETSELMVWLTATTLPHVLTALPSLSGFNAALLSSTVYLAMFATRTGLSPLHSFASAGIAALILLATSIALLAYSFYMLALRIGGVVGEVRRWLRAPLTLGLGIATATLLAATLFVTGSLLLPSLRVAAGLPATVPTMESGIRFYHPILYPISIALLAGITIAFLGDRLGWRGVTALLAAEAAVAAVLAYRVVHGMLLAPLSPLETNVEMSIGIVFASSAIAASIAFIVLRLGRRRLTSILRDRYIGIALIHLGFALTLLGVYLGGTYAFNQVYFQQYTLKPGDAIQLPGGKLLIFKSFKYGVIDKPVDIFTPYAGRFPTYMLAQETLLTLHFDLANLYSQYIRGEKIWNSKPLVTFRKLVNKTVDVGDVIICASRCNMTIAERAITSLTHGTGTVLQFRSRNATFIMKGVRAWFQLEPWQDQEGNLRGLVAGIYINATNATLIAPDVSKNIDLGPHIFYLLTLGKPYNVTLPGVGTLELRAISFFSLPESLRRHEAHKTNTSVVFGAILAYVIDGVLYTNNTAINIGIAHPYPTSAALYMMINKDRILKSLIEAINKSTLAALFKNPSELLRLANYTECPVKRPVVLQLSTSQTAVIEQGCIDAPRFVPATAYTKLVFEVVDKNGTRLETIPAVLRYEVNGEIQGIHGLVSKVIHASIGLTDVYIAVHPPTIIANMTFLLPTGETYKPVFHDLVVYYLHEAFKKIRDPGKRLVLAALLAAGLHINDPFMKNPQLRNTILEADTVALYILAEHYNTSRPPVLVKGVNIEVKLVPGAMLVWMGPTLMAIAAVLAATANMMSRSD